GKFLSGQRPSTESVLSASLSPPPSPLSSYPHHQVKILHSNLPGFPDLRGYWKSFVSVWHQAGNDWPIFPVDLSSSQVHLQWTHLQTNFHPAPDSNIPCRGFPDQSL